MDPRLYRRHVPIHYHHRHLASVMDNATHDHHDSSSYRIPIALRFFWSIILVVGMLILPKTPRYLVERDNNEAAARSLSRLRRLPEDHEAVPGARRDPGKPPV